MGRLAGLTLSWFGPGHGGYVHTSVHKSILCPRVIGNHEEWPVDHEGGRLAIQYPYIRMLTVEFKHTTLFLKFSTFEGSSLVVEAQAKPCWEPRIGSSLRLSSKSSLRDR
jgi:hypothetical protein